MIYYVYSSLNHLVKIGWTNNLHSRLRALKSSAGRIVIIGGHAGELTDEQQLHVEFSHLRVDGEWFRLTRELLGAIETRTDLSVFTDMKNVKTRKADPVLFGYIYFRLSQSDGSREDYLHRQYGFVAQETSLSVRRMSVISVSDWSAFDSALQATVSTVATTSKRVYEQTYNAWAAWCEQNGVKPLDLTPVNVIGFLSSGNDTYATRGRHLSALRMLARMASTLNYMDPKLKALYEALKMIRAPRQGSAIVERTRRALDPQDVDKVLSAWSGNTPLHLRNRALIAVLFACGMRRAEVAALRWDDLSLEAGTLTVRHGKGDKVREVAIVGDFAVRALNRWRKRLGQARQYVFCPISSKEEIGADQPISAQGVYRAVQHTQVITGVEFRPHDARRTLITDALDGGASLADVQAQAGHAQAATTLRYARPVDAKRRRSRLTLRYGKGNQL